MKNKKGFTLIELLIVIVIMTSILILAIVSINKISNKNKEKAWVKVKDEVVMAAKEYYEINAYELAGIDGINDLDGTEKVAKISVGKLTEEDYINTVTNPETGNKVNKCDYVKVTVEDDKYLYEYVENSETANCDVKHEVVVSEKGAPEVTLEFINDEKGNNDYYIDKNLKVKAIINTNGNGAIKRVSYRTAETSEYTDLVLNDEKENAGNYYAETIEGNSNSIEFLIENIAGKKVKVKEYYSKDSVLPACENVKDNLVWTKNDVNISVGCTDATSGCIKNTISKTYKVTTTTDEIEIKDNAGLINKCNVNVLVDKDKPVCGTNNGSTTWINQDREIIQNCSDAISGCKSITKKYTKTLKTDMITISDGVGNTRNCDVNVYVDKDKPTIRANAYKIEESTSASTSVKYTSGTWYNKYIYTNSEVTNETLSGTKSIDYTTTGATTAATKKPGTTRRIIAQGISTINYRICNNAGTCSYSDTITVKLDRVAPIINYIEGPKPKECGGASGVYVKYKVSDALSGVKEVYHFYGQDKEKKEYPEISGYDIKVLSFDTEGNNGPFIVERNWAVGNPAGCGSENKSGPNTSWCYVNNSAVKDYAGNTATGVSSVCSKVGK